MELSKKTTILFSPALHARLSALAVEQHTSLGQLVRRACEAQYGQSSEASRIAAVQRLSQLALPVSDPGSMKAESITSPDKLAP